MPKNVSSRQNLLQNVGNSMTLAVLAALLFAAYSPKITSDLPDSIRVIFEHGLARFAVIVLIVYLGNHNLELSVLIAAGISLVMSFVHKYELKEKLTNKIQEDFYVGNNAREHFYGLFDKIRDRIVPGDNKTEQEHHHQGNDNEGQHSDDDNQVAPEDHHILSGQTLSHDETGDENDGDNGNNSGDSSGDSNTADSESVQQEHHHHHHHRHHHKHHHHHEHQSNDTDEEHAQVGDSTTLSEHQDDQNEPDIKAGLDSDDTRETFTDLRRNQIDYIQERVNSVVSNYKGGF